MKCPKDADEEKKLKHTIWENTAAEIKAKNIKEAKEKARKKILDEGKQPSDLKVYDFEVEELK